MTAPVPAAADVTVVLTTYNTVTVPAGTVCQLVTSMNLPAGPFYYNILNMGPGSVYIAYGEPVAAGAPNVETLPANYADNGIFVGEGSAGIYVLGDASGATLSIRVAQSIGVF